MTPELFQLKEDKAASYISYLLANCCMPTLLKKKPSSMITIQKRRIGEKQVFLDLLAQELDQFEGSYYLLYENEKAMNLLIYQPVLMQAFLNGYKNHTLMQVYAIKSQADDLESFLYMLRTRFTAYKDGYGEFPHETGIFFGYPIRDVENYIHNEGKNFVFCGYWKVYDNVDKAMKRFRQYDEYKEKALHLFYAGRELTEITAYI